MAKTATKRLQQSSSPQFREMDVDKARVTPRIPIVAVVHVPLPVVNLLQSEHSSTHSLQFSKHLNK